MTQSNSIYVLEGDKALRKALRSSTLYGAEISQAIRDASDFAKKRAAGGFDGFSPIRDSIQAEVLPMQARVFSGMPQARTLSIETGRRPGGPLLHPGALRWWMENIYTGTQRVFEIARGIQRRGVKGRFFMKRATQDTRNQMPVFLRAAAKKIQDSFPKRS